MRFCGCRGFLLIPTSLAFFFSLPSTPRCRHRALSAVSRPAPSLLLLLALGGQYTGARESSSQLLHPERQSGLSQRRGGWHRDGSRSGSGGEHAVLALLRHLVGEDRGLPGLRHSSYTASHPVPPSLPFLPLFDKKAVDSSCSTQRLINVMLLAGKLAIARSWKRPSVRIAMFRGNFLGIMLIEHLASKLTDSVSKFRKIWEPWANYVHIDL